MVAFALAVILPFLIALFIEWKKTNEQSDGMKLTFVGITVFAIFLTYMLSPLTLRQLFFDPIGPPNFIYKLGVAAAVLAGTLTAAGVAKSWWRNRKDVEIHIAE